MKAFFKKSLIFWLGTLDWNQQMTSIVLNYISHIVEYLSSWPGSVN